MFEECDTHELNLFMQDKLICLVPKNLRHFQKREGLKQASIFNSQTEELRLTNSVFIENHSPETSSTLIPTSASGTKHVQNPLSSLYQTTIECQVCKKQKADNLQIHRFETHLDFNIDIPQENKTHDLEDLLKQSFKPESVEGYNCIKCSLREYLLRHCEETNLSQKPEKWGIDNSLELKE